MTTATIDIGNLIAQDPEVRGGRPRLAGTGVTVQRIVSWYRLGLNPEEIADRIGHLSLAQVHAALAYYHANREEIEAALALDEATGDQAEQAWYQQRLIESGLIKKVHPLAERLPPFTPVPVQGQPVSETILEERR
jgi:uncharacterized protein (DUF433 family)